VVVHTEQGREGQQTPRQPMPVAVTDTPTCSSQQPEAIKENLHYIMKVVDHLEANQNCIIQALQPAGTRERLTEHMDSVMFILNDGVLGTTGQQATYCVMVSTSADDVEPDSDISSDTAVVDSTMPGTCTEANGVYRAPDVPITHLQSHLHQTFAQLSSFTYNIHDYDFVERMLSSI